MNNTNNINTILEAVGGLDNEILEKAFKKKKKKPIALIVIAAAAALSLLVGAIHVQEYRHSVLVDHQLLFDIVTKPHFEAVIPSIKELTEMGVTDIEYWDNSKNYTYFINSKPSEIIEKYNLKLLINDNFFEEVTIDDFPEGMEPCTINFLMSEEDNNKLLPGTRVSVSSDYFYDGVLFCYFMVDKQSGIPVYVRAGYDIDHRFNIDFGGLSHFSSEHDYKIVDLNSGEKAILVDGVGARTSIIFGYDNVLYMMFTEANIDESVQILKNLGVIDE